MSSPATPATGYRDSLGWNLGLAAYWFASSYKWFILLTAILSAQVAEIVPEGERNTQWGLVVMIGALWAMIGPSIFGHWSDRLAVRLGTRRPFIAIGAGLTVVALMVLGSAKSLPVLIAGFLFLQFADDVGTGPYAALIPEIVPPEKRGRASGLMGLMQVSAQVISAVAALMLGDIGQIYIAIAVVNVVCAVAVLVTLRGVRSYPQPARPIGFLEGWIRPWKSRDFVWVWFTRFLNALGFYVVQLYVRNYLEDRVPSYHFLVVKAENATQATQYLALLISLCGIAGAIVATKLTDRIGRKPIVYLSGALMCAVLIPFALIPNYTVIMSLAILFGFGYGAYQSADWALVSDVLPSRDELGKDMGVWSSSVTSVQVLAGAIGRVIDAVNAASPGLGYVVAIFFGAFSFGLGTVLIRNVKGTR